MSPSRKDRAAAHRRNRRNRRLRSLGLLPPTGPAGQTEAGLLWERAQRVERRARYQRNRRGRQAQATVDIEQPPEIHPNPLPSRVSPSFQELDNNNDFWVLNRNLLSNITHPFPSTEWCMYNPPLPSYSPIYKPELTTPPCQHFPDFIPRSSPSLTPFIEFLGEYILNSPPLLISDPHSISEDETESHHQRHLPLNREDYLNNFPEFQGQFPPDYPTLGPGPVIPDEIRQILSRHSYLSHFLVFREHRAYPVVVSVFEFETIFPRSTATLEELL